MFVYTTYSLFVSTSCSYRGKCVYLVLIYPTALGSIYHVPLFPATGSLLYVEYLYTETE